MALEREMGTFRRELPRLLQDETNQGKYVLIHGEQVDSVWPTRAEALKAGYDRFGLGVFMVKEITQHEKVYSISRNVTPCHS